MKENMLLLGTRGIWNERKQPFHGRCGWKWGLKWRSLISRPSDHLLTGENYRLLFIQGMEERFP
jgi:hypothetical protein